jgi:hypothetical protein
MSAIAMRFSGEPAFMRQHRSAAFWLAGDGPSWRASVATTWTWSPPWRTATHLTASRSPVGANASASTNSAAICAH